MHDPLEITRLIHENFSTVLYFAYGQPAIGAVIKERFVGDTKYLDKTVYERAEVTADRALLEMAAQLRKLDDAEDLNEKFKKQGAPALGEVTQPDGTKTPLYLRDLTNKIIHAAKFRWDMSVPKEPKVICSPKGGERWKEARIDIAALMGLMTQLIH